MNENENENNATLMEQLFQFIMLLRRYQFHVRGDQEHFGDPHRGQGRVLALLKIKPEITQKELTYLLNMRNQSLGELLTKLERNGLITRSPSEQDRRVMNVKLTETGAEAADQLEQRQQDENKLFDCLNEDEQAKLSEYLNRLIGQMTKQIGAGASSEHNPGDFWGGHGRHRPHGKGPHGFRFHRTTGFPSFGWGRHRAPGDERFGGPRSGQDHGQE
ncbi:MarR family transcriptional regulator [Paenibacillus dokdonensis]|uniref:MarR family transcriptional regulator n=1 Tax=Paenibacillus dokdonensis TaxID=2567944 RepID=A0ABU6GHW1_9BACL|nr:MarR family transcriptional regulator [Paenibacillus dokdonensis]MEC0239334.1 MarR family transcriptional regulator [Paenibacillus dokdonensis]